MDKKQIEEMTQIMADCKQSCDDCFAEYEKFIWKGKIKDRAKHCFLYRYAKNLINNNYRKINENEVVISKEEKQKLLKEMYEQGRFDALADLEKDGEVVISKSEYDKLTLLAEECIEWRGKNCNAESLKQEDSVVLSSKEWKQIKNSLYYSKEAREKKLDKARKETAEKILQELYSKTEARRKHCIEREQFYKEKGKQALANYWSIKECELSIVKNNVIASAKQYGVEIKE